MDCDNIDASVAMIEGDVAVLTFAECRLALGARNVRRVWNVVTLDGLTHQMYACSMVGTDYTAPSP